MDGDRRLIDPPGGESSKYIMEMLTIEAINSVRAGELQKAQIRLYASGLPAEGFDMKALDPKSYKKFLDDTVCNAIDTSIFMTTASTKWSVYSSLDKRVQTLEALAADGTHKGKTFMASAPVFIIASMPKDLRHVRGHKDTSRGRWQDFTQYPALSLLR